MENTYWKWANANFGLGASMWMPRTQPHRGEASGNDKKFTINSSIGIFIEKTIVVIYLFNIIYFQFGIKFYKTRGDSKRRSI